MRVIKCGSSQSSQTRSSECARFSMIFVITPASIFFLKINEKVAGSVVLRRSSAHPCCCPKLASAAQIPCCCCIRIYELCTSMSILSVPGLSANIWPSSVDSSAFFICHEQFTHIHTSRYTHCEYSCQHICCFCSYAASVHPTQDRAALSNDDSTLQIGNGSRKQKNGFAYTFRGAGRGRHTPCHRCTQ